MSTILEAEARIKAKDQTGGVFDAIANKVNRLTRASQALSRDVEKQISLGQRAEASAGRLARAGQMIGNGVKMAAAAGAAYEGSKATRAIATHLAQSGSDRGHEEVRMRAAGMTDKEIQEASDLAEKTSAKYKSLSTTEIMHTARNVRSVVGTFEEASKIIDPLMKLRVVAQGAHPDKSAELGEDFDKLIKGMEIKGVTQDLGKFNHYINGMAKAVNVFGDTLRPTDYYEMFKYGRGATSALSDQFMLETAPTFAQEMGGQSTGKALSTFYGTVIGGKMKDVAAQEFVKFGLADPKKVKHTKTGAVKGLEPGGIREGRLAASDPFAWVNDVFLPALAAKGVTEPDDIKDHIATMFRDSTATQLVSILATQQSKIKKDWELVREAKGIDAADDYLNRDPKVAQKAIGAQMDNYFGNSAQPFVGPATGGMNWMATTLNQMSQYAKENPVRNLAGLGWLATITTALSADSLMSALGAGGAAITGGDVASKFKFGLTKLSLALAPILDIATRPDILPAGKRGQLLDQDKINALADLDVADKAAGIYGDKDFEAEAKARNAAKRDAIEAELAGKGYAGPGVPGRGMMAGSYTIDDLQHALGLGGGTKEAVKAEVVGNATLETTVKIEPSPDFWARVDQRIQNGINAFRSSGGGASGSTGSTGNSMPEATAPM